MKTAQRRIITTLAAILFFWTIAFVFTVSAQPTIESVIVGKFTGLKKGNIYTLQNGQVWKQTELYSRSLLQVRPKVTIHKEAGGAKMKVEGIDREVAVERVK